MSDGGGEGDVGVGKGRLRRAVVVGQERDTIRDLGGGGTGHPGDREGVGAVDLRVCERKYFMYENRWILMAKKKFCGVTDFFFPRIKLSGTNKRQ